MHAGTIPEELSMLDHLTTLDLSKNWLKGKFGGAHYVYYASV